MSALLPFAMADEMSAKGELARCATWCFVAALVTSTAPAAASSEGSPAVDEAEAPASFPAGWLEWSAPPECPGPDRVEARIVEWLGAPPPRGIDLRVVSVSSWTRAGWEVRVVVNLGERTGERRVRLESCADVADFVALTVALAVNPDLEEGGGGWMEAEPTGGQVSAQELSPLAEPAEPDEPEAPEEEPTASVRAPARRGIGVWLAAGAEVSVGALPNTHGGFAAEVGIGGPRLGVWVGGRVLPATNESFAEAAGPIEFALAAVRIGGDYDFVDGPVEFGPRALLELGAVQAGQTSGAIELPRGSTFWAALGFGVIAGLTVGRWLEPRAIAELSVPLTRPRFLLDDASLIHQPSLGFRAELALCILLASR